jgi:hypothetical protein
MLTWYRHACQNENIESTISVRVVSRFASVLKLEVKENKF